MRAMAVTVGLAVALAVVGMAGPARAQATVSAADLDRLTMNVDAAKAELADLRARNPRLAGEIDAELDLLRDEVSYLKVKLRREGNVGRAEFLELLDKIDSARARARADTGQAPAAAVPSAPVPTPAAPAPPPAAPAPVPTPAPIPARRTLS